MRKGKNLYMVAAVVMAAAIVLTGCSSPNPKEPAVTTISLARTDAVIKGKGARVKDGVVSILSPGTYRMDGELRNGQIVVDVGSDADVNIILDGVHIHSETSAPFYIRRCGTCTITLADDTVNSLSDGATYELLEGDNEPNAALFASCDLTVEGAGTLEIDAACYHGIRSKGDIRLNSGAYDIKAPEDAIHAKGDIVIGGGRYSLRAGDDALRSDGAIMISDGDIRLTAKDEGISAAGGNENHLAGTEKAVIEISGGNIYIDSEGDGIVAGDEASATGADLNISGGNIMIDGPEAEDKSALRYSGDAVFAGGNVVASQLGGMTGSFDDGSGQNVILVYFDDVLPAGSTVRVTDADGGTVLVYSTAQKSDRAVLSCDRFVIGQTYFISADGAETVQITVNDVISGNVSISEGGFR